MEQARITCPTASRGRRHRSSAPSTGAPNPGGPAPVESVRAWKTRLPRPRLLLLFLVSLVLGSATLHATTLRPLNIEELTQKAGTIVVGRCIEVKEIEHSRLRFVTTMVTIEVEQTLKGQAGRRLTFRMATGGRGRGMDAGPIGLPRFEEGEELILFLYPESRSGLTSPVGFGQGRFRRILDKNGEELAINDFGNRSLFDGLSEGAADRIGRSRGREAPGRRVRPSELAGMIEALSR